MEVISKGDGRTGWRKELTCTGAGNHVTGCNAVLLVDESDLYITSQQSYGDSSPTRFVTFRCIECNNETDVENTLISRSVRERLSKEGEQNEL